MNSLNVIENTSAPIITTYHTHNQEVPSSTVYFLTRDGAAPRKKEAEECTKLSDYIPFLLYC